MSEERLYEILRPNSVGRPGRIFHLVHHAMVTAGIAVMLADTVELWREACGELFAGAFHVISAFFIVEYLLRLISAAGAPGAQHRSPWRARFDWALSTGGIFDFLGALPGVLNVVFDTKDAILCGLIWVFKLVRYAPGLAGLQRAIGTARQALLSVLLGFVVV